MLRIFLIIDRYRNANIFHILLLLNYQILVAASEVNGSVLTFHKLTAWIPRFVNIIIGETSDPGVHLVRAQRRKQRTKK